MVNPDGRYKTSNKRGITIFKLSCDRLFTVPPVKDGSRMEVVLLCAPADGRRTALLEGVVHLSA